MTAAQIDALDDNTNNKAFSSLERAVIAFAEQWSTKPKVEAKIMADLSASLSPEQLVKLAATVAQANWTNRFNNSFDVELP